MSTPPRTILLVEDEPSIADPLAAVLAREGYAVHVTGSVPRAIALAAELAPDLVLLDVMLEDGSGLDVCREVRRRSRVPIIMLTARGDEADRVVGLELGADDYVVKPFSGRELVARIRAVLRRSEAPPAEAQAPSPERIAVGGVVLDTAMRRVTLDGAELALTRREFDLLALLMQHAGTVLTRERLIDEVWDTNWFGSTKTLDVHVSGLRKKLGDDAVESRFIHTVRGVGFRFAAPAELVPMSYRRRLLAAFAYVLVLVIVALALPLALSTSRRLDDEVRAQATDAAQLVAASASGRLDRQAELQELVRKVAGDVGARVIIVDPSGALLADSAGAGAGGADYAGRPEVAAALAGRTVQGRRRSDTLRTSLYTAVPVVTAGRTTAAVRLTESVGGIDTAVRRDRLALVGLCALALVLGLTVAWVLARTLARPLHALAGAARRVADGELGARADVGGSSEQQQVALAFNEMADRLTHALAAQKDFVSNASHQLRTPLTGLRLRLEGAAALTDDAAVAAEIEAADAEVVRLARLVTNLLELASADAPPPAPGPVDLAAVVADAAERWQARAAHDGRAVQLGDAAPATACSHADDVATMLDNLIENALVHSPPGGVVELVCGDDDGTAFVAVLDRGPGLTETEAEAAFERFSSGARRPRGAGGTGLGLAIVAALAARSGGAASLANRPGGGARAEIRLPLYPALTLPSVR